MYFPSGTLIGKLSALGREDVAKILMKYAPLYRVTSDTENNQQTPSDSSRNLSRWIKKKERKNEWTFLKIIMPW